VKGLTHLEDGILCHHERWDGRGYPNGLKGENIPIIGRIVNVADSYDTITTARAYKPALSADVAFEELQKCSGAQFDPMMVEAFYNAWKKGKLTKREYTSFDFSKLH
jgi:HD-GYP domain-containing protein (c-di-GMP phosphodiesterase class II)